MTKEEQRLLEQMIVDNANGKLTNATMLQELLRLLRLREKEGYRPTKDKQ
jgi:hypothetical protein